ncbi:MAG: hypothetical protein HY815_21100, partial [Candidatus Riflebacteria bacterium]|nr:hypothetical protein [Candidatus Riflebacteria bacterium]
ALPDSLALTSAFTNIRLESFLLTADSVREASKLVGDDGLLVLYNYYRHDWLVERIAGMVEAARGSPPFVTTYGASGRAAVVMAGPRLRRLPRALDAPYAERPGLTAPGRGIELPIVGMGRLHNSPGASLSTDDWPFIYLERPALPALYIGSVVLGLAIALGMTLLAAPRETLRRFSPHFFFLGAAFMLLETRSLVTFALLFGSTWVVNSLVFFAILASVLLAIGVNAWCPRMSPRPLYWLLFASLAANLLVPVQTLLSIETPALRYGLSSALAFLPIFVANLVFSRSFRETASADVSFASNLLGAMAGGLLENVAMVTGYQALLLVVMAFYLAAARCQTDPAR